MPAQSFSGSAGGINVKASARKGVFPKGTKMKVSSVSSSYVISAASGLAGEDSTVVDGAAVDITFFNKGKEIQPADGSVGVSLSSRTIAGDDHEAVHISGGGASMIGGASSKYASFRADHFSIYGIIGVDYENPDVEKYARYTYVFKVNGQEMDRQIVKDGEEVTAPEAPADKWFKGWEINGSITKFPLTAVIPEDETEDKEITVEAGFEDVCQATFYKYEGDDSNVLQIMEEKKGTTISTAGVSFEYDDGSAIVGWKEKGTNAALTQVTLNRDYELVPIISTEPLQVTFVTGEGTPIAPVFIDKGKKLDAPVDPTRTGYEFKGWFIDEACTKAYDFDTEVTEALTLYAGWEGSETDYSVVYWKQNANDDNYTFVEMDERKGNAGTAATFETKDYTGFTLNATKTGTTVFIKGDGTTIKNVYYDRKTYPLTFYVKSGFTWKKIKSQNFKYEEDTSKFWKSVTSEYKGYNWYISRDDADSRDGGVIWADAKPMQIGGIEGWGKKGNGSVKIKYVDEDDNEIRDPFTLAQDRTNFIETYVPPVIPGFTFKEWKNSTSNDPAYIKYTRNTYSLRYVTNGGPAVGGVENIPYDAPLNGYAPASYTVGQTTKTVDNITYTFEGWYDNQAYAGSPFNFNSKMPALEVVKQSGDKATLVLYAKWMADEHTVNFDLDGGSYDGNENIPAQAIESGKLATAPENGKMEKADATFGYWMDEVGNRFSFDTRITRDYTLKAHWNSDNSRILKVIYDAGEGTGAPTDGTKYQEGSMAVIKGQPTPPKDKNFIGWKVGESSTIITGGSFQLKAEDAVNGDITLTALYMDKIARPTSVTYNANGGTIKGRTVFTDDSATVNDDYTIISDVPVRDKYEFLGWSTDANAKKAMFKAGETVAVGSDGKLRKAGNGLYAVWKKKTEKVTVSITGHNDTVTFDGKEHKVEGYDVNITNERYTEDDFEFKGNAVAKGTEVGTYKMGLDPTMFENTNEDFEAVFIVEDGVLEIQKTDVLPDHEDEHFEEEENDDGDEEGNGKKQKSYVKGAEDEPDTYVKGKTADVKGSDADDQNGNGTDGDAAKTGDEDPLGLWVLLMIMAIVMAAAVTIRARMSIKA